MFSLFSLRYLRKIIFLFALIAFLQWLELPYKRNALPSDIHLNYNENAYGPSPSTKENMRDALKKAERYPDEALSKLTNQLAHFHSVQPDQILVSGGLSSILRTVTEVFLNNNKSLIVAYPTFEDVETYASRRDVKIIKVPLTSNYEHDLDAMLEKVDPSTGLIYICNPNNPTGTITPRNKIEEFLKKLPPHVIVFIDEAYHHFAADSPDYHSFIDNPMYDSRIIVGRSFSKAYGLAGLRLGYIIGSSHHIQKISQFSALDTTNIVALEGASIALKDQTALKTAVKSIANARQKFYNEANKRGLQYIPSHGNFVMLQVGDKNVPDIIQHFKNNHILIGRTFLPLNNYIRISMGLPEQMEQFWKVWDSKK